MPRIKRNYANIDGSRIAAIGGTALATPKTKKKIRYSVFFLTWNSNKYVPDETAPEFKELELRAENYWNQVFEHINDYIIIKKPDHTIDDVKNIVTEGAFEIGSDKRMFHAHMYIRVDHYTSVQLDLARLRKEIAEQIGEGGWLNLIPSNDTTRQMIDYINKNST